MPFFAVQAHDFVDQAPQVVLVRIPLKKATCSENRKPPNHSSNPLQPTMSRWLFRSTPRCPPPRARRHFKRLSTGDCQTDHQESASSSLWATPIARLVSQRYKRGSILLTSNRAVSEWASVFGDAVVATAILDRMLHHSHVLTIRGDSYRLREKKRSGLLKVPMEAVTK